MKFEMQNGIENSKAIQAFIDTYHEWADVYDNLAESQRTRPISPSATYRTC
jgi:hypothetical protein